MTENEHHIKLGFLILAGIAAGALTGVLIGLLVIRQPHSNTRDEMTETVDDLKRRAEQILTELLQTYSASSGEPSL